MICPKCRGEFEQISFNEIVVSRCRECFGLWFDTLAKDELVKMQGAESIDIGSGKANRAMNQLRRIDCPSCQQQMIEMVDKDQFHIEYEACPTCFGLFFDAGEFSDLKEHTVVERFHQIMDTLRSNVLKLS